MTDTFTFTDRESYFKWLAEWKASYMTITGEIRTWKRKRKQFIWKKPDGIQPGDKTWKIQKVGPNPLWDDTAQWQIAKRRKEAHELIETRIAARDYSRQLRAKRLALAS